MPRQIKVSQGSDVATVTKWATAHFQKRYPLIVTRLEENYIDGAALLTLTQEEMKEIFPEVGLRKAFQRKLQENGYTFTEENTTGAKRCKTDAVASKSVIRLFYKSLTGSKSTILVHPDAMIEDIIRQVHQDSGTPVEDIRLIYGGRQLCEGHSIEDYNIAENSVIHFLLRQRGS